MLDERPNGLCRTTVVDAILAHLELPERAMARDVLMAAVRARNVFAHGAIGTFDDGHHKGIGHLFIKAQQLLMSAGLFHMTREAAYYRSLNRPDPALGSAEDDWIAGETAVLDDVMNRGRLPEP
jgi:hypothetical protein